MKNIEEIQEEKKTIAGELEDLLVLLSDQDAKCKKYKVGTRISNTQKIVDYWRQLDTNHAGVYCRILPTLDHRVWDIFFR